MSDISSSPLRTRYRYTGLVGDWVGGDGVGVNTPSLLRMVSMSTLETEKKSKCFMCLLYFSYFLQNKLESDCDVSSKS